MANTWEDRIRNVLGGIKLDPKANAIPGEGALPYMGRRIKEAAIDAYQPIKEEVVSPLNKFLFGAAPIAPSVGTTLQPKPRDVSVNTVTRPEGTATIQPGTDAAKTVPRMSDGSNWGLIRTPTDLRSPENPYSADVTNPAVRTGQIRVGAATDAEAARNLESRALQDQAVQAEVARLNRATEAVRSLNEARNPRFSFGASSIGGGPDTLDVASGRVINRDTPVNVVADRMRGAIESSRGLGGGKAGRLIAEQMGKAYIADKELQQAEMQANVKQGINPLDLNRFILDQQKFAQQQGLDKARLNIDEATLRDRMTGTALEGRKYADARKKDFMSTFSYPDKGAPTDQIASTVLAMSDATGGVISPEQMTVYFQQAAKEAGVDWKNAPPKDFKALADRAMALATAANR